MRILKLPAKILYYVSDEFNKIFKNVFLCVSIQIAARISTGKSDMAIAHCWICFAYVKTKTQISCAVTAQLISAFVFATLIGQSLFFLVQKFSAFSHHLRLQSPVYVGPGRKPRIPVFSHLGSIIKIFI